MIDLKELVLKGIRTGVVQFIVDPNMDHGTVAKIGDYWFYFGGLTAEEENPDEYVKEVPEEDIAREIAEVISEMESENPDEAAYYKAVLEENAGKKDEYKRFLVFIDGNYVEGIKAYLGDCLADDIDIYDEDHEGCWGTVEGSGLVLDLTEKSLDIVINRIKYTFPDASGNIFRVFEIPGEVKEHYLSW